MHGTPTSATTSTPRQHGPGTRYTTLRQLGAGPDASAFAARDEVDGSLVELRHATVAERAPEYFAEVEQLARSYALLQHPGWRRVRGFQPIDGLPVLVLEGLLDRDLSVRLALGPLPASHACSVVAAIAHALEQAHRLGVWHGHLGPSSVFLDESGQPLLDFPWLDAGRAHTALDTACRVPREEHASRSSASDIYSLGMLLRVLLLGHGESGSCGALDALITRMTALEPEERPSAADAVRVLDELSRVQSRAEADAALSHAPTLSTWDFGTLSLEDALLRPSTPVRDDARLQPGMQLGRFELVRKIGEGGMGEVYRAIDRASGVAAAIKVLHAEASRDPARARRFRKEARVLAEVKSPYVAGLLEVNSDAGVEYIALELVEGTDLAQWVAMRGGRLPEHDALSVIADVCRGLAEAHARGIVHRDIKPENVLLERVSDASLAAPSSHDASSYRVKLCDFGIARTLDHHEGTLGFTQEGKLLGTPEFMAPEQCNGRPLSPATDVYALGATLFSLIAGRTPFTYDETTALLIAHVNEAPPRLNDASPDVSDATAELVASMLSKAPAERPTDAAAVLERIERIVRGEPTAIEAHPLRPLARAGRVTQHVFEWELKASPRALWPFVSNTDRLNRAVGLPPAAFEPVEMEGAAREIYGANRVAGVDLRWREHPFEWIEGRRWGVLRVFERGVMCWFTIELELFALPAGGTRLRYTMTLEPRHWLGALIVSAEMRFRQRPALGKAFARIDAHARVAQPAPGSDAFEPPQSFDAAQRALLDQRVLELKRDGVSPAVLDALAAFCERAPAQEVARLRPLAFAHAHQLSSEQVIEACLHAAHRGLLVLLWDVLCPLCRVSSSFVDSLQALADHAHCPSCNQEFTVDFAQSVELVFRVSPELRGSELRTYCIGGPAFAPHVVAQARLAPGERVSVSLELGPGSYVIRSPQQAQSFALEVSARGRGFRASVAFGAQPSRTDAASAPIVLGPGVQSLAIDNALDREIAVRIERTASRADALTAARAACLASFRRLFPGQVLASGRLVAVGRTAFLVTRIHEQRKLLEVLGDARAFERLLGLVARLEVVVAQEGGAVVKTASGATLSAFASSTAALRAGLALRSELDGEAGEGAEPQALDVRVAVHAGPAVAATFDGKLDYFGQTVERALELSLRAPAEGVLLSSTLARDEGVLTELSALRAGTEITPADGLGGFGLLARPPA